MADRAIVVNEMSKGFVLGVRARHNNSLRESLVNSAAAPIRRMRGGEVRHKGEWLWALDDVSFEIVPGETVGIIGRNGAGKSTLLKILSRITRPTKGWAEVHGRVGSLLEVGTGFHSELTGRENVFLNGSILGMRRTEIQRRFDEIVEFAEVADFLDTPVKRYSSGMRVRLAFAVAAHLEPEILIVDEVLAVGDLAFQRKCLGKMGEVTQEGRTVLFVSHNMAVIQSLCRRGILLEHGKVTADGPVDSTVAAYLKGLEALGSTSLEDRTDRRGWGNVKVRQIDLLSADPSGTPVSGAALAFRFHLTGALSRMALSFTILDHLANPVMTLSSDRSAPGDDETGHVPEDRAAAFECIIDELPLVPGRYRVDIALRGGGHRQDLMEGAVFFDVADGLLRERPVPSGSGPGPVVAPHHWTVPMLEREMRSRDAVDAA